MGQNNMLLEIIYNIFSLIQSPFITALMILIIIVYGYMFFFNKISKTVFCSITVGIFLVYTSTYIGYNYIGTFLS